MVSKAFDFLIVMVFNGFVSLFVSIAICVVLVILFAFALLPVSVIFGEYVVIKISDFVNLDYCLRGVYVIIFFSMMMDDFGVPNFKTAFKKWRDGQKAVLKG